MVKIGIIGGSGLDNPKLLEEFKEIEIETPFGKPSSPITYGKINGTEIFIISRHGRKHQIPPTQINNKANIFALKDKGCKFIISTTAAGSLREEIKRGDFVILNQFIDFTKRRDLTFFDKFEFGPMHTQMENPFSEELRGKLIRACKELKFPFHEKGTVITIEGPRFSTKAESKMFQKFGADMVNMSIAPEVILANEAEIPYATVAMSTDYDCWKEDEEPVSWEIIREIMKNNSKRVQNVLLKTIEYFSEEKIISDIKEKIRTIPDFPKPGIRFRDITTLFKDRTSMKNLIELFQKRYKDNQIDIVAGVESRGFIIGGILAEKLGVGFVPIRKKGKLPAETIKQEYDLEYGKDIIEVHKDAIQQNQKVLLIDDLIATGGTMIGACSLIENLGGQIVECACIIELEDLGGRKKLEDTGHKLFSIVKFKENEK
jgi:5'-methylthioadenosine phosphorylase